MQSAEGSGKLGKGARRWNGYFGAADMLAVAYLMRSGHHSLMSDAIRKAIVLQAERDRSVTVTRKLAAIYKASLPYDPKKNGDEQQDMPARRRRRNIEAMKRRFIWLSDYELECLREIAAVHGLRGYSEAARMAIQVQASLEGYK